MEDQVCLIVGTSKFLMSIEEAMSVAVILNGCNQIGSKWVSNGGNRPAITDPDMAAAHIVPLTAHLRLTLETTAQEGRK